MKPMVRLVITLSCTCLVIGSVDVSAAELQYPVACYAGDSLAAIRAWEDTWVGRKITGRNVDEVKEFLPETFYNLMKDTSRWGETWFVIVPYRQIMPSPGKIEFTKKYHGQPRLEESGEIINYTSGVPFPDTHDPTEMAHNFRCKNYGDTQKTNERGFIIDGKLKYDMALAIRNNYCFFSGRTDKPPVPELPDNPKQLWRAFSFLQIQPPEVRDLRILEFHYKDRLKAFDSWIWNPTIRRVRRRSTTERQDAQGGADFCGFDNFGWDGPVSLNTYTYIGTRELLLVRHNDAAKLEHTRGDCLWNGTQRERIRAHVIEAINSDPNFLYSRMTWYLDPETWQILYSDRFDRNGRLWKVLDQQAFVTKGYGGFAVDFFSATQIIDVQRTHSTLATAEYEFGSDLPLSMFRVDYLQKHGY